MGDLELAACETRADGVGVERVTMELQSTGEAKAGCRTLQGDGFVL